MNWTLLAKLLHKSYLNDFSWWYDKHFFTNCRNYWRKDEKISFRALNIYYN
jgi:hypothetical protein